MNQTVRRGRARKAFAVLALSILVAGTAAASGIGRIKTVEGEATLERAGAVEPAVPGLAIEIGDLLETGADGAIGLLLNDDTRLALGPGGQLVIAEYLLDTEAGEGALTTRLLRGTLHLVSGLIAKIAPQSARVDTPVATVGIRGTRLIVRVEDGAR